MLSGEESALYLVYLLACLDIYIAGARAIYSVRLSVSQGVRPSRGYSLFIAHHNTQESRGRPAACIMLGRWHLPTLAFP